jgi:hypothetical protein
VSSSVFTLLMSIDNIELTGRYHNLHLSCFSDRERSNSHCVSLRQLKPAAVNHRAPHEPATAMEDAPASGANMILL